MESINIECQEEVQRDHGYESGIFELWLAVTFDAVRSFTESRGKNLVAKSYLFEEDNPFVDAVCDHLYISPEAMRERIKNRITHWC